MYTVGRQSKGIVSSSEKFHSIYMLLSWVISTYHSSIKIVGFGLGCRCVWGWVDWWVEDAWRNGIHGCVGDYEVDGNGSAGLSEMGLPYHKKSYAILVHAAWMSA